MTKAFDKLCRLHHREETVALAAVLGFDKQTPENATSDMADVIEGESSDKKILKLIPNCSILDSLITLDKL